MSTKTCNACGETKDTSAFYTGQAKCKPCFLARQKAQKEAKAGGKPIETVTRKKRGPKASPPPDRVADSLYSRPGGMGFSVQLEVDENTKATDIKLMQYNAGAEAEQTIWLSQLEAQDLQAWLADHLGKP